jgi:hypothetical protein
MISEDRETHLENIIEQLVDIIHGIPIHIPGLDERAVDLYNEAEIRVKPEDPE